MAMSRSRTFLVANLGHFADHYFLLIFPTAVLAIHREWQMSYGDALALGTPMFVAFALATLPAGWLGDHWSRARMLAVFFIGLGVASVLTGFAAGPISLAAGLGGIGVFAAIYHPVGLAMVSELADRPGRALAINGVYGNLGLAAAALGTAVLTSLFGWRSAFVVPGLISIVLGVCYGVFLHRTPQERKHHPSTRASRSPHYPISTQLRALAVVCVAAFFGGLVFNVVTVTLPKIFELKLGAYDVSLTDIGFVTSATFAVAAFAQLPVGALLDRFGGKIVFLCVLAVEAILLWVMSASVGAATLPIALALVVVLFAELPVTPWLLGHFIDTEWRARAFAIDYVLALGVGALALPFVGWAAGPQENFSVLFVFLAGAAVIVFLAAWLLPAVMPARRTHVEGAIGASFSKARGGG